ncbi:MAG: hypothetical protein ACFFAU_00060 [Candidatus Hodarchaeota archaeon]
MKKIPALTKIVEELFQDQNISQIIVSTIDGSPIYGKSKEEEPGDELHVIPAAVSSALAISNNFLEKTFMDGVNEYVVFQERSIIIATKSTDTILITTVNLPKSSFENRPALNTLSKTLRNAAEKINAIVKTLDIEDSLIEKLQRAIPEATAILLLSTAGIPLSDLLSSLNVDSAQLAAVSSALSLPTRVLGQEAQSIAVTGKNNMILLYSLDADRILMVSLKPKESIENYLTKISRLTAH